METDLWHAGQILTVSQFALISLLRIDWHNLFNFITLNTEETLFNIPSYTWNVQ